MRTCMVDADQCNKEELRTQLAEAKHSSETKDGALKLLAEASNETVHKKDATIAVLREELHNAGKTLNEVVGDITDAFAQRPSWTTKDKCKLIYKTMVDACKARDQIKTTLAATPEANIRHIEDRGKKKGRTEGIKMAAEIANTYNRSSSHPYRLGDCIQCKLNVISKSKIRKNKHSAAAKKHGGKDG